ncbi:hypothetical protein ID866_1911 [Astraeus odoratus]|nr:hypothetical protein ID866_1911 [Astraeus odoratus]
MEEDGAVHEGGAESEMAIEETAETHIPQKRGRLSFEGPPQFNDQSSDTPPTRTPKRLRRAKDLSAYEEAATRSHPLNRKTLKRDAKRARRTAARLLKGTKQPSGMDIDELQGTFITGVET